METRGRALYNLIRMNWLEDPKLSVQQWQVEDYRKAFTEDLFDRLNGLNIRLDENQFKAFAEHSLSPEELTETIVFEENAEEFDQIYLLVFELWRRFLPEKESLSIFCDELDNLIDLYDREELENEEALQDALLELERILDEHVDRGEDPKSLLKEVALYCAHDLESFIYDYASKQIDEENHILASEIVDGFGSYMRDQQWLEFLQLRLLIVSDTESAQGMLSRILKQQDADPDFELLLEIARFLIKQGEAKNFLQVVQKARDLLETEQDFQELLAITCEFYRLHDREEETKKIFKILRKRQGIPLDREIAPSDKTFQEFFQITHLMQEF